MAGVVAGASNDSGVVDDGNFPRFSESSTFRDNCVKTDKRRPILSAAK